MTALPLALHTPDGFLSPGVAAVTGLVAIAVIAIALRASERELTDARVPMLGVLAAFVFAAQMLNFPVAGGTSGHFVGAALAAVLLGPWLACVVLTVVIGVQAFGFADGGIAALGANVLNMGILGALLAGFALTWGVRLLRPARGAFLVMVAGASWLAVMVGAGATAVELAASGTVALGTVLPAMLGVHVAIGIGEAAITAAAVGAILAGRPDLIAVGDLAPARGVAASQPAGGT